MSIVKFEYDTDTAQNGYTNYSFKPSDFGIRAGQRIGIICVGGGGAGGGVKTHYTQTNVAKGGDAGKAGQGNGGGGGIGYGAGGGGASGSSDAYNGFDSVVVYSTVGEGGGGGGYVADGTLLITTAIVNTPISVAVGKGGEGGYGIGADGNPTSFGSYITANGGVGGGIDTTSYGGFSNVNGAGGTGRTSGGNGYGGSPPAGGGGGGGWQPGQVWAGNGTNASAISGGYGGGITTGGGAQPGQNGGVGHGVCFVVWED